MGKNVREDFGVLAAVAELTALAEGNPVMRQVMLRLAAAYRELDVHSRARKENAPRAAGTVVEIGVRLGPCRRRRTAETTGRTW